jgi:hypothetical protein
MSTRIKDDDPNVEKAYWFADKVQAARQPTHPGMCLGDLISAFEAVEDKETFVQFDFGGFQPNDVDSYRGYYCDLALSYDDREDEAMDAGELLDVLKKADGQVFTGYKGGDYRMDRSTPVWVANYGRSHGVAIMRVEDQKWRVVIHTALID